ncbi:Thioredoxin H4-1 [Apostasia shenzhenica]|uniref:Thioredoxin H4-1 n=1 Tax=Apostasia shenzhenica TaxID=1088818 RepID=A0A2I0A8K1_9ASPA|nr:Thioredoxin H4-1 [Apostasia shenzhenica]
MYLQITVNFSASWCKPCRVFAPFYSELSKRYPTLLFLIVDVDELTALTGVLYIRATPTIFFREDGEQLDKLVGANQPELENKLAKLAKPTSTNWLEDRELPNV